MRRDSPVPAGSADLDQVVRLAVFAAEWAVIGKTFRTHRDETLTAVTEAFRPAEKWPEYVWLDPPYRPASPPKAAAP